MEEKQPEVDSSDFNSTSLHYFKNIAMKHQIEAHQLLIILKTSKPVWKS